MNETGITIPDGKVYARTYDPHRYAGYALVLGLTLVMFAVVGLFFVG